MSHVTRCTRRKGVRGTYVFSLKFKDRETRVEIKVGGDVFRECSYNFHLLLVSFIPWYAFYVQDKRLRWIVNRLLRPQGNSSPRVTRVSRADRVVLSGFPLCCLGRLIRVNRNRKLFSRLTFLLERSTLCYKYQYLINHLIRQSIARYKYYNNHI